MVVWASIFWTLAIGTSDACGGVERKEMGSLIVPWEDSVWVVSVGFDVLGLALPYLMNSHTMVATQL